MKYRIHTEDGATVEPDATAMLGVVYARLATDPHGYLVVETTEFPWQRWRPCVRKYGVHFAELFADYGIPDVDPAEREGRRQVAYVQAIDRENRRIDAHYAARQAELQARHVRGEKYSQGVRRGVVCLDNARRFSTVVEAAEWLGVKQHSTLVVAIQRGRKCGGLRWQYADVLLKELQDEGRARAGRVVAFAPDGGEESQAVRPNHAALLESAQQAVLLSRRAQVEALSRKDLAGPRGGQADQNQVRGGSHGTGE